eukprot:11670286-Heterocapsa_arctica.AAC.1
MFGELRVVGAAITQRSGESSPLRASAIGYCRSQPTHTSQTGRWTGRSVDDHNGYLSWGIKVACPSQMHGIVIRRPQMEMRSDPKDKGDARVEGE